MDQTESEGQKSYAFKQIYQLKEIQRAMARQKSYVEELLDKYQINSSWDKIKKGFMYKGIEAKLSRLVKVVPCDIKSPSPVYLLPYNAGEKVYICYNKIRSYDHLDLELTRKLLLAYDIITLKTNPNNVKELAHSEIKALNLSKTCSRNNKECFNKYIDQLVSNQDQFKGKRQVFEEVFDAAIHDVEPMNQLKF